MSRVNALRIGLVPFIVLGLLALALGCGGKKSGGGIVAPPITTVPANWGGVWSMHTTAKYCGETTFLVDSTTVDTICPGGSIADLLDISEDDTLCDESSLRGTETSATYSCTERLVFEGCTITLTVTMTSTFNATAGTMSTAGRLQITGVPASTDCPTLCIDIAQTGTRTGPTPASCPTTTAGIVRRVLTDRSILNMIRR